MRQLVNDLLEYSRVETKAGEFKKVDLEHVAARVRDELHVAIEDAGAMLVIGPLPTVLADEVQMRQLLTNLIANGIKFRRMDVDPVVEVSAQDRGNEWLFAVKGQTASASSPSTRTSCSRCSPG
jgi:light-regulated signal transduction histidine kinase (bacteriophytochrome)